MERLVELFIWFQIAIGSLIVYTALPEPHRYLYTTGLLLLSVVILIALWKLN